MIRFPYEGQAFRKLKDWKQMEVTDIAAETPKALCLTKLNGVDKWFPREFIRIERTDSGRLLVKYPEWID